MDEFNIIKDILMMIPEERVDMPYVTSDEMEL